MNRKIWKPLLGAALLATPFLNGCKRQPTSAPPAPVPEVAVVTVTSQQIVLTTELPGRTSGYLVSEIRPQVNLEG